MARPRRRALQPSDIEGLEYFDTLVPLLAQLKDIGTQRDRAGNRQLFYDREHSDFVGLGSVLENCLNHLIFKVLPSSGLVIRP